MTSGRIGAICAIGVTLFALAYLAPETGGSGPQMDEGAVVSYSQRVLEGAVPHRDFLTFYGPGNLWAVAGAFTVLGESVTSERIAGLGYRLLIVLALFLLGARLAGPVAGVLAGLIATVILAEELVWAYATYGALAFGLVGVAIASWAGSAPNERRQELMLGLAGVLGGFAVLVRFDFAPAVVLSALPLLTLVPRRSRWWYGLGLLAGVSPYVLHLAIVGPERIARVVSDLVASGPGRSLPLPRPGTTTGNLLGIAGLVVVLFLVVGLVYWRRRPRFDPIPQVLVAVALFALCVLPYTLSRPDRFHVRPFALVSVSLLPALVLAVLHGASLQRSAQRVLAVVVAGLSVLAVVTYGDFSIDRARELRHVRGEFRGFAYDSQPAVDAIVARLETLSRPGESVFVGPQDLRRTNYGPTYMYSLLDDLRPASYYMEMNPGTANREGSGLADELRRADWLVLTSEWDDWNEPNDSTEYGPSEPNEVVRDDFCLRLERGEYRLYERCDRAA